MIPFSGLTNKVDKLLQALSWDQDFAISNRPCLKVVNWVYTTGNEGLTFLYILLVMNHCSDANNMSFVLRYFTFSAEFFIISFVDFLLAQHFFFFPLQRQRPAFPSCIKLNRQNRLTSFRAAVSKE